MKSPRESARRWLLLDGNRYVVAGALLGGIFLVVFGLGHAGVVSLADGDAVRGVGGSLIPGLFTFVSIVLAINQLVLSEEFGTAEEIRDRIDQTQTFRHDVEELAHTEPSPILPTLFLELVVDTIAANADSLRAAAGGQAGSAAEADLATYAEAVAADAREAREALDRVEPGRVNAVLSVLAFNDAEYRYRARRLETGLGDAASPEVERAMDGLVDALDLFNVARSHFRMTYTQRLLARLSRLILYAGVPALLAAIVLATLRTPAEVTLLARYRLAIVSGLVTVAMSPLAVLFAYILRVAAVSERTVGVSPFVSRPGSVDRTEQRRTADADAEEANIATEPESGAERS